MRIVLDTNVLVRANAKAKGPARELLLLIAKSPEHVLLLSPFLLKELEHVLGYDRVQTATKLTADEVAAGGWHSAEDVLVYDPSREAPRHVSLTHNA